MTWPGQYFVTAAVVGLFCLCARAAETNAWHSPVVISASHRFVAGGMASPENVSLAASAEETADKIEALVGLRIPFAKGESLHMFARWSTNEPNGRVVRAQGWVDRSLSQKLIIVNPERADQEDVLEGLCWLLLNRYVISRQSFEQKTAQLGSVPDWLSTGVAQNLYMALRTRNNQVVIRRWLRNEGLPFSDILNLDYLPDGRWGEKAFCGLAVDWIASSADPAVVFGGLFSDLAGGDKITTNRMSKLLAGQDSGRELEKSWDLWIASLTQVKQYWGGVSAERLAVLKHLLAAPPDEMGIPAGERVPSSLTIKKLIKYRDAPWMPLYASRLNLHIRGIGIGEAKEFRDVLELYGKYLAALARPRKGLGRFSLFRASPARLKDLLAAADKGLADLESSMGQSIHYVSGVEATVSDGIVVPLSVSNTIADMDRFIPRSADGGESERRADE
jgi:hypothetical protein